MSRSEPPPAQRRAERLQAPRRGERTRRRASHLAAAHARVARSDDRYAGGPGWGIALRRGAPVTVPESLVDVGGPDVPNWQGLTRFVASPEASRCPVFATITRWQARGRTVNYRRGRIDRPFDARVWYASELLVHCRAADLEGSLYSQYAVPFGRAAHVIVLNRVRGEAEFTDGQRRLLHLFHAEPRDSGDCKAGTRRRTRARGSDRPLTPFAPARARSRSPADWG